MLSLLAGPVTTLVTLIVIDKSSSFNAILGHTWIHAMKALPSFYQKNVEFPDSNGLDLHNRRPESSQNLL